MGLNEFQSVNFSIKKESSLKRVLERVFLLCLLVAEVLSQFEFLISVRREIMLARET